MSSNKYSIKIPNDSTILYSEKKKIITVIGPLTTKTLKLNLKLKVSNDKKLIIVTSNPFLEISNNQKKKIKALQGTTSALIKQSLIETSTVFYQKLKFVGVGYRAFDLQDFENKLLMFKLGYSHPIYFKIPKDLKIFCLKLTKLFVYGNSYQNVTKVSSIIQSYKMPEPYKGKGILYENEKIQLKEGKKV
jgi:large subunit ribosomal protein L6